MSRWIDSLCDIVHCDVLGWRIEMLRDWRLFHHSVELHMEFVNPISHLSICNCRLDASTSWVSRFTDRTCANVPSMQGELHFLIGDYHVFHGSQVPMFSKPNMVGEPRSEKACFKTCNDAWCCDIEFTVSFERVPSRMCWLWSTRNSTMSIVLRTEQLLVRRRRPQSVPHLKIQVAQGSLHSVLGA